MKNVSNADESVSSQTNLGESKCQQNTWNRTTMNIGVWIKAVSHARGYGFKSCTAHHCTAHSPLPRDVLCTS